MPENSDFDASDQLNDLKERTKGLESGANAFSRAMTNAFANAVTSGKQFDDVLKSLALRLSNIALRIAFKPIADQLVSGLQNAIGSITSGIASGVSGGTGEVRTYADGGIIGTPTFFPMLDGRVGLAGEAGPEAVLPLTRGADGRLGVASGGGGGNVINVTIATPDADSFRRSETYLTGQIARAVSRGQRGL